MCRSSGVTACDARGSGCCLFVLDLVGPGKSDAMPVPFPDVYAVRYLGTRGGPLGCVSTFVCRSAMFRVVGWDLKEQTKWAPFGENGGAALCTVNRSQRVDIAMNFPP